MEHEMDSSLTAKPGMRPAPAGNSASVRVMDGAVYLPEGKLIASGSPAFEQILNRNLPSEIAPDVLAQWRGVSGRTTRLQRLGTLLALLGAAVFLYFFFPETAHRELKEQDRMEIMNLAAPLRSNSPYRGEYESARKAYDKGNYHAAAEILKSSVTDIIRIADRESDPVLFLYFDSLLKLKNLDDDGADAVAKLRVLRDSDRDNPVWVQFAFELDPRIRRMRNYPGVRDNLCIPAYRNSLRTHLYEADYALKQLRILRALVNPAKFSQVQLQQYKKNFDLFEVQLRLSRWLLAGTGAGKSTLPDNLDDPGVTDREKALRLARQYEKADCADFWQARRFIAETLCSQDSLFNHIYWNGQYLKTQELLIHEIKICNQRLNPKEMP